MIQITELEDDLYRLLHEQQSELHYRIEGTKIRFEKGIKEAQRKLKTGFFKWFRHSQPRNVITAPVIYSMIIPFLILDIWVTVYQRLCFPMYRISLVKRSSHIVIDHHHLHYLNSIERLNCIYCSYANGVIAYVREVAARTEQYWCPIKHARKLIDPHRYYARFADFGQGEGYHKILHELRKEMRDEFAMNDKANR